MKKLSAFSLTEISIAILIIGVLIAGVSQGKKLLKSSRLSTARSLTQQSPVADINDLALWYETTLDTSFIDSEAQAGVIGTWIDNNPQALKKNNATQSTTANKPLLVKDVFNGSIPAVRFDGSNDYLSYDGSFLAGSNYTIFIVEQRRSNATWSPLLSGSAGTNANLIIWYEGTAIRQSHFGSDLNISVPAYSSPITKIHSFWFSQSSTSGGKKYWANGGITPAGANSAQTSPLTSYAGAAIGASIPFGFYLNGDIAEIIMFTRDLKIEEKLLVEGYLAKKYNIPTPAGTAIANSGAGGGSGNSGSAGSSCSVNLVGISTSTVNSGSSGNFSCSATGYTGTPAYSCSNGVLTSGSCSCATGYTMVSGTCQANCSVSILGVSTTSVNAGASGNFTCSGGYAGSPAYSCTNGSLTAGTCNCATGYTLVSGTCQANCSVSIAGVSTTSVNAGTSGNFTCSGGYSGNPSYICSNGTLTAGTCTVDGHDGCTYDGQSCTCNNTQWHGTCSTSGNYYGDGQLFCHCTCC